MAAVQQAAPQEVAVDASGVLTALAQRLRVAADELLGDPPRRRDDLGADVAVVLGSLVDHLVDHDDVAGIWLVLTAVAGGFPSSDEVLATRRRLPGDRADLFFELLSAGFRRATSSGSPELEMDLHPDQVLVDVDFCATSDLHTGIQRVVRETLPRWTRDHELVLVGWTRFHGAFRGLSEAETHRVLRWGHDHPPADAAPALPARLIVPWRSRVVLPENPEPQRCPQLEALARFSGNRVGVLGYDCIPLVSPELIHPGLPDRFMTYLTVVKHADAVSGISASAATEFEGFARMLSAQGLRGPVVTECSLPVEVPRTAFSQDDDVAGPPTVFAVGSFEPRKNQVAVLHAAERLWREGLQFELVFVGGGGYATDFDVLLQRLTAAGRSVTRRTAITDAELWGIYRRARFTIFASLHEGFGLPVAESLALGTPAIATAYGSTAEIAAGGGVLTVDPRDDEDLLRAMRDLLTDDDLLARLEAQTAARPPRTWDDYSAELWSQLVDAIEGARP